MMMKGLAIFILFSSLLQTPAIVLAQTVTHPAAQPGAVAPITVAPGVGKTDCNGGPCEDQQPRYELNCPAPPPVVWSWHDRILWGAYLVLAMVGYVGVMVGVSTLKRIERNTAAAEAKVATAPAVDSAAADMAQAALLHAQAMVNAERPWVLVTAEPARGVESSFEITATNRGRSPATITSALDDVVFAADEAHLPATPEFKVAETGARFVPIILLPGESATLKSFSREDVKELCGTEEKFKSVESWEERIFLCGKVSYNDLIAPAGKEAHETRWCCWYIHGKQRSALVPAGGAGYSSHT